MVEVVRVAGGTQTSTIAVVRRTRENIWLALVGATAGPAAALLGISASLGAGNGSYSVWTSAPAIVAYVLFSAAAACLVCALYEVPITLPGGMVGAKRPRRPKKIDQGKSVTDNAGDQGTVAEVDEALTAVDPGRAARLIGEAESVARSLDSEYSQATELASIARNLAATDRDEAARIFVDAERAAEFISVASIKADALAAVARGMAATDPDGAERVAQSITVNSVKAITLVRVASETAAADPRRAARLIADADRTAQSIKSPDSKAPILAEVARIVAAAAPERSARLIADAERTAKSATDPGSKATTAAHIALTLAATDPDRAESIAKFINPDSLHDSLRDAVRTEIATTWAATDPNRAERLARSITSPEFMATGLADVARVLQTTDPDRAGRLIDDAELTARTITSPDSLASALSHVARALAATDPDRAERIAESITSDNEKSRRPHRGSESAGGNRPGPRRAHCQVANRLLESTGLDRDCVSLRVRDAIPTCPGCPSCRDTGIVTEPVRR